MKESSDATERGESVSETNDALSASELSASLATSRRSDSRIVSMFNAIMRCGAVRRAIVRVAAALDLFGFKKPVLSGRLGG